MNKMMPGHPSNEIQIRLTRIDRNRTPQRTEDRDERSKEATEEKDERPKLRRTIMPSRRVLERRERQRALNERIRDTYYDRINGNFFPMEQIEE